VTTKYRVAVIGLGRIGAQLENDPLRIKPCTHLYSWLAHSGRCEVVAICDSIGVPPVFANLLGQDNAWNHYTDYQKMLTEHKVDIVSIATPDNTHKTIARNVMGYDGVKLIFLEKPIAENLEDADSIISRAREFPVKLAINHTRRWDPVWQAAGKLCQEEQPVNMICLTSGSPIRDGVHMADLINWFQPKNYVLVNPKREQGEVNYLLFEVDLLWKDKRVRVTDNGMCSTMYQSEPSTHYENLRELTRTCQVGRQLYPHSMMYYATEQLLDCLDSNSDPLCDALQGRKALERCLSHTWV
jgi:hypothetical protein